MEQTSQTLRNEDLWIENQTLCSGHSIKSGDKFLDADEPVSSGLTQMTTFTFLTGL
ncbi:MAG: hypothetical protein QHC79_25730 [Pseudosphingobacterium sp.]|nr:hypothetical protein [Pseudosphingobacterium sp.]